MKGTVKFFNAKNRFGFIAAEDGTECFVHLSSITDGNPLNEGNNVEFDVEQGERGPKAANVKKV